MKKLKLLFVAFVLILGATSFTYAQSKVAHINTADLVQAMPSMKQAQSQLEKIQKTYDTELRAMAKELDAKSRQYAAEAESKTEEQNRKRVEEVQTMQNNIAAYQQQALKDLQQKERDIFEPILNRAKAAIQKVARNKGFEYVLDSSEGSNVILAEGFDLLADVKKELGI
jgi:outer membrane protein